MKTKLVTILLSLAMVIAMMPMMAFADVEEVQEPAVTEAEEEILSWDITSDESKDFGTITATLLEDTKEVEKDGVKTTEHIGWVLSISGMFHDSIPLEQRSGLKLLMKDFSDKDSCPWSSKADEINNAIFNTKVYNIGAYAFAGCTSLSEVFQITQVETIGDSAFEGAGFAEFTVPGKVTSIGDRAFANCNNLRTVTMKSTTPPATVGTDVFPAEGCTVVVPGSALSAYRDATAWAAYASQIQCKYLAKTGATPHGEIRVGVNKSSSCEYLPGEEVYIYVKAAEGYKLSDNTLKANKKLGEDLGEEITLTDMGSDANGYSVYKFTMPESDVVFSATFEEKGGSGEIDPDEPGKPSVIEKIFDNIKSGLKELAMRTINLAMRVIEPVYSVVLKTSHTISRIAEYIKHLF